MERELIGVDQIEKCTFSGRRFTRDQLEQVKEMVDLCKNLSRKEIALTICQNLNWFVSNGSLKINSCISLLEQLDEKKFIVLPPKQGVARGKAKEIILTDNTKAKEIINCSLTDIEPIELQIVSDFEEKKLWNEYVQRYHYLGYKHPFGFNLRYFIVSEKLNNEKLGCLLFTGASSWALEPRDNWIGWKSKDREKRLNLILNNGRFLIFPWVQIENLASKALSLAARQIKNDWQNYCGHNPVLIETFVDTSKYQGTCYQAANWQYLGDTTGRGRSETNKTNCITRKKIFVLPLDKDFREILKNEKKDHTIIKSKSIEVSHNLGNQDLEVNDPFLLLWSQISNIVFSVANEFDNKWQVRSRVINSMLLILLIFRLVFSKNNQGYGTTIAELWENARKMNIMLPQPKPIAASSFAEARMKLDESIFQQINTKIISTYEKVQSDLYKWHGHRIFAVDGSKINLPAELIINKYRIPTPGAHYPQGLLSVLYQLKSRIPFDFMLESHTNERTCAIDHLKMVNDNDIVVYDRGYYSYELLSIHKRLGVHAVFRLKTGSNSVITEFQNGSESDKIVEILPGTTSLNEIKRKNPKFIVVPIKMRLIKYEIAGTIFYLGTTLLDPIYPAETFPDVYHSRWGIEELYKVSKQVLTIEELHSKNERGVKQELFASFVLITLSRIFANRIDFDIETNNKEAKVMPLRTNYKNCISTVLRNVEGLFLSTSNLMKKLVQNIFSNIMRCRQRVRPNRSYERKSMKPENKWRPSNKRREFILAQA